MYIDNPEIQKKRAEATKKRRENLVFGDKPYKCKKCGIAKHPNQFVIHRMDNHRVGKYRYLYECKDCKKNRIYAQRNKARQTIEWAIELIFKWLKQWAKKRDIPFEISVEDLLSLWHKQKGKCYYSWYPMKYKFVYYQTWKESDKTKRQVSCDRLDNNLWYQKGNIVLCCTIVNKMKNTLSTQEFYKICQDISEHNR